MVHSFDDALARAQAESPAQIGIIGGAAIYREALPRAARIELTEVHVDAPGDVRLPPFDKADCGARRRARTHATAEGLRYSYVTLER